MGTSKVCKNVKGCEKQEAESPQQLLKWGDSLSVEEKQLPRTLCLLRIQKTGELKEEAEGEMCEVECASQKKLVHRAR